MLQNHKGACIVHGNIQVSVHVPIGTSGLCLAQDRADVPAFGSDHNAV